MNSHQKMVAKLAKINMEIYDVSFPKAKRIANEELLDIKDMLITKYGFKRK